MQRQKQLISWCERIIEGGWLLALTLIPIYFNLYSARHFEPDKATTLRSIVVIMVTVALIRAMELFRTRVPEHASSSNTSSNTTRTTTAANPLSTLWKKVVKNPLGIPVLLYSTVFLVSTIFSVVPYTSFWGSYQRLQGTYTNLSYIALFVLIIITIRKYEQLERLITVALTTGLIVSFYGIVQHNGLDPLPWSGDVTQRVASTMGNSIFVAAYLLMVVPLGLYRIATQIPALRRAPPSSNPTGDILWALANVFLIIGTMAFLVSAVKFSSVARAAPQFWWVFPGAVIVATGLWVLPTLNLHHRDARVLLWPAAIFAGFVVFLGTMTIISTGGTQPAMMQPEEDSIKWWHWLFLGTGGILAFYGLAFFAPRQPTSENSRMVIGLRLAGSVVITGSMLLTIFYSQSRGPWLGLSAALFVFFSLLLWVARRHAARHHASRQLATGLRFAIWGWVVLTLAGIAFVALANFSNAQFFQDFRKIPYIGRAGTLFESGAGTGLVRKLIWIGDEHGGGTVAMITDNPFRTIVGWGPESMFVVFNQFYPPSLANIESRQASPDRSHQAMLDELATKGVLGLVSYFFVLISFAAVGWRILTRSKDWQWQMLALASLSAVAGHVIEGLTGIPIVATLMMLWVTMAIGVVGGRMAGVYTTEETDQVQPSSEPSASAEVDEASHTSKTGGGEQDPSEQAKTHSSKSRNRSSQQRGQQAKRRGADRRSASTPTSPSRRTRANEPGHQPVRSTQSEVNPAVLGIYGLLLVLALGVVWWSNFRVVYADMRYQEGETYDSQQQLGLEGKVYALSNYLTSIAYNRHEDYYYLALGRTLMNLAQGKQLAHQQFLTEQQGKELTPQEVRQLLGDPNPTASVADLLNVIEPAAPRGENVNALIRFVDTQQPLDLLSYAEAVLLQAQELNPLNKDHYANLGRLYKFWFNLTGQIDRLEQSAHWYEQVNEVAPQDVSLINESADVHVMLGNIAHDRGNTEQQQEYYEQASQLYQKSITFDATYGEADLRLLDIYLRTGRVEEATNLAVDIIQRDPRRIDERLTRLTAALDGHKELLLKLRDAYLSMADEDAQLYDFAGLLSVRGGDMQGALDAYEKAVDAHPRNVEHRINYTIVLSDTRHYEQALSEAQDALSLAEEQQTQDEQNQQNVDTLEFLVSYLEQVVTRGQ